MIPYARQSIDEDDIRAVLKVFKTEWLTTGPFVSEFESDFAHYIDVNEAVAVNSGTSALDIAVQALDIPRGSEVITTPFTFVASSNALLYNGLKPVFADITPATRNINYIDIKEKITSKTKAILYVDYAGHPCNIDEIRKIANDHDLKLIEDACHALGATYRSRKVGRFADATIFSFHPVKHITTGEGGMVVTNNPDIAKKARMLRNHGINTTFHERKGFEYDMKYLGHNYRMTDIQAALGTSQLKKIEKFIDRRTHLIHLYNDLLVELADKEVLSLPTTSHLCKHAWHLYTILIERNRDIIFKMLKNKGVGTNVHYIPIYRFSYYKDKFNIDPLLFPETEYVYSRILTLPLFPAMLDEHVHMITSTLKETMQWIEQ